MPDGKDLKVPKPGPAKLSKNASIDEWLQKALNNQYLPEQVMKKLCEICKEYLMEGRIDGRLFDAIPSMLIANQSRIYNPSLHQSLSAAIYMVNSTMFWSFSASLAACPVTKNGLNRRAPLPA